MSSKQQNYHQLFDSMLEAFSELKLSYLIIEVVYDAKKNPVDIIYREMSRAAEELIGKTKEELIGKSRNEVFGNINDNFPERFDSVLKSGEPAHFQNYGAALKKYYDVYAWKLVPQSQGAVLLRDITDR